MRAVLVSCFPLVLGLGLVLGPMGCKPKHPFVWASQVPAAKMPVESTPLRSGDVVALSIPGMEEEVAQIGNLTVTADGHLTVPLVGPLPVEGLTVTEAAQQLNARLRGIVRDPAARITVINPRMPSVSVVGEVRTPGRWEVDHGEGVLPALARAGGLTEFADSDDIYVVRKYPQLLRVRFRYDDLVGGDERSIAFELRDGDVIVVQ